MVEISALIGHRPYVPKGDKSYLDTSTSAHEIWKVTQEHRRVFRLLNVILTNFSDEGRLRIYDAVSTATPKLEVKVGARETVVLGPEDLIGDDLDFISSVAASFSTSGAWIHVGGVEF